MLERLAERPATLTGLARDLGLSPATAHAVLGELEASGWVVRDASTREFSPGPTLRVLGARVASRNTAARVLCHELGAELDLPVSLSGRAGQALVVEVVAAPKGGPAPEVGQQVPFAPPFGAVFAAFGGQDVRERWIGEVAGLRDEATAALRRHLDGVADRGYSVERLGPAALRLVEVLHRMRDDDVSTAVDALARELMSELLLGQDGSPATQVTVVAAPVRDARGRVTHTLNAHPFRRMSRRDADALGKQLVRAAAELAAATD